MDEEIRVIVDVGQEEDRAVECDLEIFLSESDPESDDENAVKASEYRASVFLDPESSEPTKQPFHIDKGGGRIYLSDGGNFIARFHWKGSDGKERSYDEALEVPIPPTCPSCERRVPELVDGDYLCTDCRFG